MPADPTNQAIIETLDTIKQFSEVSGKQSEQMIALTKKMKHLTCAMLLAVLVQICIALGPWFLRFLRG